MSKEINQIFPFIKKYKIFFSISKQGGAMQE